MQMCSNKRKRYMFGSGGENKETDLKNIKGGRKPIYVMYFLTLVKTYFDIYI